MDALESVNEPKKTELSLRGFDVDVLTQQSDISVQLAEIQRSTLPDQPAVSAEEARAWDDLHEATNVSVNVSPNPSVEVVPTPAADDGKTELHELPSVHEILGRSDLPSSGMVPLPPPAQLPSQDLPSHASQVEHPSRPDANPAQEDLGWEMSGDPGDDHVMVLSGQYPGVNHESTHITTNVHSADFSPSLFQEEPRFQHRGLLAKGGMGFVCRAFDRRILRSTAMKLLKPELAQQKPELQRFLSEAQITGQLEHPNIVPVYDVGVDERGRYFFTMQMVRGRTLRDYLRESHYDPSQESSLFRALQIFLKVCDALAFAHSRGILHRDLKPSNIMVGDFGEVYLMDWGIASVLHQKGTETRIQEPIYLSHLKEHKNLDTPGSVIGSVSYIAPEQAQGDLEQLDKRTDIFSLGAILYQMLTLTPPYQAKTFPALVLMARKCDITPPQERVPHLHLPRMLCDIAMQAMRKDPTQRFQTVHELKDKIEAFMHGDERFPRKRFPAGTQIIREGDAGDMAYGILKGRCLAYKIEDGDRVELREMGPGEVFGEASVLSARDRSANVESIDDVMVICLSRDTLDSTFGGDSWMGRLVQTIAVRFNDLDRQLSDMRRHNKMQTLANRLLICLQTCGQRIDDQYTRARWSVISTKLIVRTSMTEEELRLALARVDGCFIDLDQDSLTIDVERLEDWLDQTTLVS